MTADSRENAIAISIVIVNWNTRDLLLDCLRSIRDGISEISFETFVVDNASSDGSAEAVREQFPGVRVIAGDTNVGFAAANNKALKECSGEMILLLNPDTVVPAGELEALRDYMLEHPEVGMAGPKLFGADGGPQVSSFGLFPSPLEATARALRVWRTAPQSRLGRLFQVTPDEPATWTYTNHLLGACILMRREVYEQTGGFDEGFLLFLEETDLCYRAAANGWKLAYYVGARTIHVGQQSVSSVPGRSGGLYIHSYNRFCRKYGMGPLRRFATNICLTLGVMVDALAGLVKSRSPRRAAGHLQALWFGYFVGPQLPS